MSNILSWNTLGFADQFRRLAVALLVCMLAAACSVKYPTTRTDVVDERPQLVIANAAEGAVLLVNDVDVGLASKYDGKPGTLRVPKGINTVEVLVGGQSVHKEKVFLTDGVIRTITVPGS